MGKRCKGALAATLPRHCSAPGRESAPSHSRRAAPSGPAQHRHSLPLDGGGGMLSDDVAGGVRCSLMSVPAPGSAGREWASGAQRSRAAASARRLQEGSCFPHSARPRSSPAGRVEGAPTHLCRGSTEGTCPTFSVPGTGTHCHGPHQLFPQLLRAGGSERLR